MTQTNDRDKFRVEDFNVLKNINIHSQVAVYLQIENEVRFAIASGRLKSGDQLPSVREASENLQVNPNTVAKAYRDLEVMGLLYTRRGMGVYIKDGVQKHCGEVCARQIAERTFELVQELKAAGVTKKVFGDLVSTCWTIDANPYAEVPRSVTNAMK